MRIDSRIRNIDFDGFPQAISMERYERCKQEFTSYFQPHSAISAVYQIGDVNDAGISDLDLILVFRENGKFSDDDYGFLNHLDKDIFVHAPFVIPERLFPFIQFLFYTDNLRKVVGEDHDFLMAPSETEQEQLLWLLCAEAAIARLSDLIYQITLRSHLDARKMLLKINSIKHNINLYAKLSEVNDRNVGGIEGGEQFKKEITEIRKSWFLYSKKEQIDKIILEISSGIGVLSDLISKMFLFSREIFDFSFQNRQPAYYLLPDLLQIFKFEFNFKTNIKIIFNPFSLIAKIGKGPRQKTARHLNHISVLTLPYELVSLFFPFNQEVSLHPRMMKNNLIIRGDRKDFCKGNEGQTSLFQKRFHLINEYNDFIRKKKKLRSSISYLLMAPWLVDSPGKFYFIKRAALQAVFKLNMI